MRLRTVTLLLPLLALSALLCGCGDTEYHVIYMDEPVEFDVAQDDVAGEPELVLGALIDQRFEVLEGQAEMPIIFGFQGGTWVHLSIRAFGVRPGGEVSAKLGSLGQIRYPLKLTRGPEGHLEAWDIPVPVAPADGDVQALYGQTFQLDVTFTAGDVTVENSLMVTLVPDA